MKTKITAMILLCILTTVTIFAKAPIRYVSNDAISAEYTNIWRGQNITKAEVPSHENIQHWALAYAPVEYIQILLGVGMSVIEVDEYKQTRFDGNHGFSFTAGCYLNSPAFLENTLRITGGLDMAYLNSKDDDDFRYNGPILDPHLGLLVQAGPYFDIEAGARGHFIIGTMRDPESNSTSNFSNKEILRGYGSITICSSAGAYATFRADVSPATTSDWHNGPVEASLGFTVGFTIKDNRAAKKSDNETKNYFPEYDRMKDEQDQMMEEIKE